MNKEPLKLLADIIKSEMGLDDNHVYIYNQKRDIPKDKEMFVVLGILAEKPFVNNVSYDDRGEGQFYEIQKTYTRETIEINIFSKDDEARLRRHEIVMALQSTFAKQVQDKENFQISRLPISFNDLSSIEETARLNRFNISFNVLTWYVKEKQVEYYDDFNNLKVNIN